MSAAGLAYDAIVLAGGRGSRLGGVDKGAVEVGGAPLLDRAVDAASRARVTIVVGPSHGLPQDMLSTREEPPLSGPVAAIAAGLTALPGPASPWVLVLACDMPFAAEAVDDLVESSVRVGPSGDGVWAVDEGGRTQPLLALYRRESLERALSALETPVGASMRHLTHRLEMGDVPVVRAARDADTWDDVRSLGEDMS
ncbi:molybdenum cofactor guanylyltransferase [Demequina sp. NBRC 110055]|uniref:molybdenum cofactor guanylyltransferase n=1 Tax=Demequina sp. NBRC 110055 TaxID=1570344 RepID=UPI0009FC8BDD|nr:molybdenum cofactor guanylyltransferase [Demequina sp. NBRC 110055]